MNFFRRSPDSQRVPHLAGDAGVDTRSRTAPADPVAAWIDLMDTVEALRPQPARPCDRAKYDTTDYIYKL